MPHRSPTPKVEYPKQRLLPLSERRPSWSQQGGHYFFRLCSLSLSRKASNAITKLPKAISKPIIPINIKMISAAVIDATSLPMYSGKPVIGSGGYHPCHGFHIEILPQFDRNFNQILFSWNMWKVFQNQSQNNLTKEKERLESTDFTHFSVQMSVIRTQLLLIFVFCKLPFYATFRLKDSPIFAVFFRFHNFLVPFQFQDE